MANRTFATTTEAPQAMPAAASPELESTKPTLTPGLGRGITQDAVTLRRMTNGRLPRAGKALRQLQQRYGNGYVQRLVVQAKMVLGPVHDPYEREADRAAAQVAHRRSPEGATVQQQVQGTGGVAISPDVELAINQARTGGRSLPGGVQQQMGQAFNADFSQVRVHTDTQADHLNRSLLADAFTVGQHLFFRRGEYNPATTTGQELLAHELTHVIQQNGGVIQRQTATGNCRCPACTGATEIVQAKAAPGHVSTSDETNSHHHGCNCSTCQPTPQQITSQIQRSFQPEISKTKEQGKVGKTTRLTQSPYVIQRHSSYEHRMLGDVDPNDLEILGAKDNLNKSGVAVSEHGGIYASGGDLRGKQIKKENVLHVLSQEIARLEYMRDHGPKKGEAQEDVADRIHDEFNGEWQVKLVTIPNESTINPFWPPLVVTYGELNTLADIYGSIEEMKTTDPENRWKIVQGIRQQSLFMFYDMVNKVKGNLTDEFADKKGWRKGFEGAIGSTGRTGERGVLGQRELSDKKTFSDPSEEYQATLARNACHFAPESWHTWADYHQKARNLAQQAYDAANESDKGRRDKTAQRLANEAWLTNGFGDHFLQDSYASGHLINKTQIMMWFVKWIDDKGKKHGTGDEEWRQIRAIAASQTDLEIDEDRYDLDKVGELWATDPQSVENMSGDWFDRFSALGLQIPPSVTPDPTSASWQFLVEWQSYAAKKGTRELPPNLLEKVANIDGWDEIIHELVNDNVVQILNLKGNPTTEPLKHSHKGKWKYYRLHPDYVPSDARQFDRMVSDIKGLDVLDPTSLSPEVELKGLKAQDDYSRKAAAITYKGFHNFMRNARLQFATNVLHNKFCAEGLLVKTGEGTDIGRIYGDNAMLSANSSKGVKHSAETTRMSRQAIQDVLNGYEPVPLQDISNRFPAKVEVKGNYVSLAEWNKGLRKVCEEGGIFEEATSGLKGFVTKSISLGKKISKDDIEAVHKGEAF